MGTKKPEMVVSATDSFDRDLIPAIWGRLDQKVLEWRIGGGWGSRAKSAMPWMGFVAKTPGGESGADSLCAYALELIKKYPEIHISISHGDCSVSNYGKGVYGKRRDSNASAGRPI